MRRCNGLTVTMCEPRTCAHDRDARSEHGYLTTDACMRVATMRVFEHFEACPTPRGGGPVTRSMRRVAHATERCNSLTVTMCPHTCVYRDARSEHGYLTTDARERLKCGCLSTVRVSSRHAVVGQSPDR
jgi:hypothetical protein